jgi:hypothetical protein
LLPQKGQEAAAAAKTDHNKNFNLAGLETYSSTLLIAI